MKQCPLICLVGPSGSGKSTIARMLEEKHRITQVKSFTTREPRNEEDKGYHTFVTKDEFAELENLVAYSEYDSNKYGVTETQLRGRRCFVVDPEGLGDIWRYYTRAGIKSNRQIHIYYVDASVLTRLCRMLNRGDNLLSTIKRIVLDQRKFKWVPVLVAYYLYNKSVDSCCKEIARRYEACL